MGRLLRLLPGAASRSVLKHGPPGAPSGDKFRRSNGLPPGPLGAPPRARPRAGMFLKNLNFLVGAAVGDGPARSAQPDAGSDRGAPSTNLLLRGRLGRRVAVRPGSRAPCRATEQLERCTAAGRGAGHARRRCVLHSESVTRPPPRGGRVPPGTHCARRRSREARGSAALAATDTRHPPRRFCETALHFAVDRGARNHQEPPPL